MTLPIIPGREDPIFKPATKPCSDPAHGAAFIFLHGLGDSAEGIENVADQFQSNNKLTYMNWIIPNAMENRDVMQTAWFRPTDLSTSDRPELQEEEDEAGLLQSIKYIESLIDACVRKGIPPQRIVLGGFSQGCALSLLLDLTSKKYSGRLAGIAGLMGFLPLAGGYRIQDLRAHASLPPTHGEVPVFLARGQKDMLIPTRVWNRTLKKLDDLGLNRSALEVHEYEGLGHSLNGAVLGDLCNWMERIVPKLED